MKYIPLGTEWLGCIKWYCSRNDNYLDGFDVLSKASEWEQKFDRYQDMWIHKHSIPENFNNSNFSIKNQIKHLKTFPEKSYRLVAASNGIKFQHSPHSFSTPFENWLNSSYGLPYLIKARKKINYLNDTKFTANGDFIIENFEEEKKKYKDKSVLIIGGGPSASDVDFSNLSTDFVWASNNFFLNDKFSDIKLDSLAVTPYMNISSSNQAFTNFLEKNNQTRIFFETERGDHEKDWHSMYRFFLNNPNQSFLYGVRYRSKLGITPRQICLAIFLGIKDIYVVGFDGVTKAKNRHAFEETKESPDWLKRAIAKGFGSPQDYEITQFVQFWNYIYLLKNRYDFNIINLAENIDYNLSSEITKWLKSYN